MIQERKLSRNPNTRNPTCGTETQTNLTSHFYCRLSVHVIIGLSLHFFCRCIYSMQSDAVFDIFHFLKYFSFYLFKRSVYIYSWNEMVITLTSFFFVSCLLYLFCWTISHDKVDTLWCIILAEVPNSFALTIMYDYVSVASVGWCMGKI